MPDFSEKKSLHWWLFQDDFSYYGKMTFASPVLTDCIRGKASHVQMLDGAESLGEQQGSHMYCMCRAGAGRGTQTLWAQLCGVLGIALLCME